jgi:1-acyl-sn-glycerol-3-phosphate acyltransferase
MTRTTACDWTRTGAVSLVRGALQDGVLVPLVKALSAPFHALGVDAAEVHGPLVIVANHGSHLDTPAILAALPPHIRHRTAVAAAADYFYRNRLLGAAASVGIGTFAFPRRGAAGTRQAAALLCAGWNVLLFPQGTRGSADAEWQPFKSGVGHLVAETGAAVLPVGVYGTRAAWPRGQRLPRRGPIEVRLGSVWQPSDNMRPAEIVAEVERRVAALASTR